MTTLYVHPMTVRYYDYDELLDVVRGIAWSTSNDPSLAIGFERGVTVEAAFARFDGIAGIGEHFTLAVGERIERSHNLNPHGLI